MRCWGSSEPWSSLRARPARPAAPSAASAPAVAAAHLEEDRAARLVAALPFAAFTGRRARARPRVQRAAAVLFGVDAGRAVGRAIIEVVPSVELERMVGARARPARRVRRTSRSAAGRASGYFGITAQPYDGRRDGDRRRPHALARAASACGSDFVGNVSHELRTPLSAMKLMLETVMVADDDAEARALFLPQIADELERMIRLVEDLLELARSESGTSGCGASASISATSRRRRSTRSRDAPTRRASSSSSTRRKRSSSNADRGPPHASRRQPARQRAAPHAASGGRIVVDVAARGDERDAGRRDTGAGFLSPTCRASSSVSTSSTARARASAAAPGSAWRSPSISSRRTAGRSSRASVYGQGATFTLRIPAAS